MQCMPATRPAQPGQSQVWQEALLYMLSSITHTRRNTGNRQHERPFYSRID